MLLLLSSLVSVSIAGLALHVANKTVRIKARIS